MTVRQIIQEIETLTPEEKSEIKAFVSDLYDIAASYAFHLAQAQAFLDGISARPLSQHSPFLS